MTIELAGLEASARPGADRDARREAGAETPYRLAFRMATEAACLVDADTLAVVDANLAAARRLGLPAERLRGAPLGAALPAESRAALEVTLATAAESGRPAELELELAGDALCLGVTPFRHDGSTLLLVSVRESVGSSPGADPPPLEALVERVPDAVVLTDGEGRIRRVNPAFLDLSQLVSSEAARGRSLSNWVGRRDNGLSMLLAVLKNHGSVRGHPTSIQGEHGHETEVELSAARLPGGERPRIGFIMHRRPRHGAADTASHLATAVEGLTERVGSVSLPDLVRDTTDLVERHFIRAALELTGGNRTTAADVLGMSRQSLYVKLRRFRLQEGPRGEGASPD